MTRDECSIADCHAKRGAGRKGWCENHYARWWRTGDPLGVGQGGPNQPRTKTPGYHAVHRRLRQLFGKASDHVCVVCGEQADDWAFDEPTGYSDDLTRYRPLCRPHHRLADNGVLA